jgi:ACT domain-containing protein
MSPNPTAETNPNRVVVSVQGIDRVGIVAEVARVLAEGQANLTDISQSILHDDLFVMVAMANLSEDGDSFEALNDALTAAGTRLGVEIRLQREQIFRAMHRV